jgi:hypothetical protein
MWRNGQLSRNLQRYEERREKTKKAKKIQNGTILRNLQTKINTKTREIDGTLFLGLEK